MDFHGPVFSHHERTRLAFYFLNKPGVYSETFTIFESLVKCSQDYLHALLALMCDQSRLFHFVHHPSLINEFV